MHRARLVALFVLVAVRPSWAGVAEAGNQAAPEPVVTVAWRGGAVDFPVMKSEQVAALLTEFGAQARGDFTGDQPLREVVGSGVRHVLAIFDRPLEAEARDALAAAGLKVGRSVAGNAYFAAVRGVGLDAAAVARPGGIAAGGSGGTGGAATLLGVYDIAVEWKLHPLFLEGVLPTWAVVEDGPDPVIGAYVLLHSDADLQADGALVAGNHGANVRDLLRSINGMVVELPLSAVAELAAEDAVQWVEPPLPRMSEVNDSNRAITEANLAQSAPYNLTGAGVTVLVYDAGTARSTHVDFQGRLSVRDSSGTIAHATHVSGTIGGAGVANAAYKGMAPGVTIQSYGFEYDGSGTFLYTNPGDIEADYNQAINTYGSDIANNSIGTNTESNGFLCTFQGMYGVTDMLIDEIVRGSLGAPFRVVWANGNERQGSRCDVEGFGDYYSVAPPACAKNHLTVGALNSNDDSMTSFSSWGPTDDGRMKPDVSAPGCQSDGDGGVTSCNSSSDTSYTTFCGTSMASPTTCGLSALLLQDFRAQFPSLPDFRNSTLRILLAHSAQDRGNTGPDYQFGYGSVRIKQAIDLMRTGAFTESSVDHGGTRKFTVAVPGGASVLKVTLAWDDVAASPNVNPALVNDLDLRVFDPSGNRRYPWTLNPLDPSAAAVQNAENHLDNIEQVLVNSPASGTWRVEIHGYSVPQGPQSFSVCCSHALTSPASLVINLPDGLPSGIAPNTSPAVAVQIAGVGESVVAGTERLYFRYNGGSYQSKPLTSLGGGNYSVNLPPPVCAATPEFYFAADGTVSGTNTNPIGAPASRYTAAVGSKTVVFDDNFQTDKGWTVTNVSLTDGPWERAVPSAGGDRGDPVSDYDGSGYCYVTDNAPGNSDVDGGPTRLQSPLINMSGGQTYLLRYARLFSNDDHDIDRLLIEISNNNGSTWTTVEDLGNTGGWGLATFTVNSLIAPTANMRVRFSATDNPNDSVTEAAVDAFEVSYFTCTGSFNDCNGNGIVDSDDIASGRSTDSNGNGVPDECEPNCPVITDHPDSQAVCAGGNVTFTVVATGDAPLSYQWRKNGSNIGGATGTSYTINGVQTGDAGAYDVVVTNGCGSVDSNDATLTVNTAPSISQHPQSQTVCAGGNVTFTVTATGTAPLSYQWRKNGSNIGGATGTSYTINGVQTGDAGAYDVVVTNGCGSVDSNDATLTVNTAPSISQHPQSQTVCAGGNVTFTVTATGTAPLSYQWRKNGSNIGGATGTSYTINGVQTGDAGAYDVVVTNGCGSVDSNDATLTVNTAPSISQHPQSQSVNVGDPVTFTVVASGTAPLSYQWRKGGTNIGGATNSTYSIVSAQAADAGVYDVVVSNLCGSINSDDATLAVNSPVCDPCDTNCDGSINGFDIADFIAALGGSVNPCSPCNSDTNGDGSVNGFDIAGFINCLGG